MEITAWKSRPLSELADDFVNGGTPSTSVPGYWNGQIPWLTGADIKGFRVSNGRKHVTNLGLENSSTHLVPENTVLLVTRTSVGKVAVAMNPLCFSQDITGIKCRAMIRPAYLARFLSSIQELLISRVRGSTIKGLARRDFDEIEVPVPPLDVQERIEAAFDKVDALRSRRYLANQLTNKIIQSVFLKMFGDPAATNPQRWRSSTIGEIVTETQYGISKGLTDNLGDIPIMRMNNIATDGRIDLSDIRYVNVNEKDFQQYRLRKGDILFNRTNSRELVGKTGLISVEDGMVFASYLIRVRTKKGVASPEFLWAFLNSAHGKRTLLAMARGAVGQANINSQELKSIKIPAPPFELQQWFSSIVQRLEPLRGKQAASTGEIDNLFQSLMHKAFSGQLKLN